MDSGNHPLLWAENRFRLVNDSNMFPDIMPYYCLACLWIIMDHHGSCLKFDFPVESKVPNSSDKLMYRIVSEWIDCPERSMADLKGGPVGATSLLIRLSDLI